MQQPSNASRRNFLTTGTGALLGLAGSSSAMGQQSDNATNDYAVDDQLAFRGQTRRLKLTNGSRYMASVIFATDYPTHFRLKPELYPVCTPAGVPVTDSHQYCFIHHQSIMTGHGKVLVEGEQKPIDFYRQLPYPDDNREDKYHKGHNLFQMGPSGIQKIVQADWTTTNKIVLNLRLEWQSRIAKSDGGQPIVLEQRQYNFSQRGPYTIIDQFSQLTPADRPFTLQADRHSFVGIRVHDMIDPDEGGLMRDSEKRTNPDGNFWNPSGPRKAPRWIDCTGKIGNQTSGITLISHPQNVRNEFYSRGWGLMICSPALGHDVAVSKQDPFRFAARFVAHDGELTHNAAEALYADFSQHDFPADI